MNAQEVLRRYAAGERNFRNVNLRGANFKGQDLSGTDFSKANIRGATFNNANLQGTNFSGVQAGWRNIDIFRYMCLIASLGVFTSLFQSFLATFAIISFTTNLSNLLIGSVSLIFVVTALIVIGWQGFTDKSLLAVIFITSVSFVVVSQVESSIGLTQEKTEASAFSVVQSGSHQVILP